MKIPENATPKWFDEQAKKGTFDAVEWVRWIRSKDQELYEKDPTNLWNKVEQEYKDHIKKYGSDIIATELEVDDFRKVA